MFRRRDSHKKPNEDFYLNFKSAFSAVGIPGSNEAPATPAQTLNTAAEALDLSFNAAQFSDHDDAKDLGLTPRGFSMDWKSTPVLLDPNNNALNSFTNHWSGYYPPTPGGFSLSHHRAGDLHTLVLSHGQETQLSRPASQLGYSTQSGGGLTMNDFHLNAPSPRLFQSGGLFDPNQPLLDHQLSAGFDHLRHSRDDLALLHSGLTPGLSNSPHFNFDLQNFENNVNTKPLNNDPFRFRVTLNAPTAMIKDAEEIPISYLNKCQTYSVSISDNHAARIPAGLVRYRTFIRVSFEDEQQRARPAACWQLWKEGRGMNEAHQRGGKLQAVEFVGAGQSHSDTGTNVELIQSSFDGFCITWNPNKNGLAECAVSVRFNFLSTDFSHSKGVKGIPVRLCAKTEIISTHNPLLPASMSQSQEIWYCKVKLFRDHGAERKLSNDVSHVKKTIEKLKQQISQLEATNKDGKRRRSDSLSRGTATSRPSKISKHKRTWSMSSSESTGREPAEDDLQQKLAAYQAMFTSTRPISILFLKGEELDDPDMHPVQLHMPSVDQIPSGPPAQVKLDRQDTLKTMSSGSTFSPTVSSASAPSAKHREPTHQQSLPVSNPISRAPSSEWAQGSETTALAFAHAYKSNPQNLLSPPDGGTTSVPKRRQDANGQTNEWIDALDIDQTYQTPPASATKPAACFYIRPRVSNKKAEDKYYRAIYLQDRTVAAFTQAAASRCGLCPAHVREVIRVHPAGLEIKVDDEVIQEMREGQDMNALFEEVPQDHTLKQEPGVDSPGSDATGETQTYLLKLEY